MSASSRGVGCSSCCGWGRTAPAGRRGGRGAACVGVERPSAVCRPSSARPRRVAVCRRVCRAEFST
eukprot:372491-Lingulodinium_polyedra.AAC.1